MESRLLLSPPILKLFDQDRVKAWLERRRERFEKGEEIDYPGKLSEHLYFVVEGNARIYHLHADGKECVLGIARPGDFIDIVSLFAQTPTNLFATALTATTVVKIPKAEIVDQVLGTPQLAMSLLQYFADQWNEVRMILEQVAYEKVEERLLTLLEKLGDEMEADGEWIPLPPYLTHKDMAGMIASTRETVTFLLNKLVQSGEVRFHAQRLWYRRHDQKS